MGTIVRRCLRSLSAISTLPWAARHDVDGLQKNWIARMVGGKSGSNPREIGPGKVHVALAKQIPSRRALARFLLNDRRVEGLMIANECQK
jgi:hypothetical protein